MNSIIAIIFGIVQGLTEFIPVSSSGHLLLLHEVFSGFHLSDEIAFDVALHMGTLAALFAVFWKDCFTYFTAFFIRTPQNQDQENDRRIARLIVLAVIPAGIAGVLFEDIIDTSLRSTLIVVVMLIVVAILFFLVESKATAKKATLTLADLRWPQALFIGCMQIFALIPGTSRSGITIVAGIWARLRRDESARFSFLIAIPLILAAGLKKMADLIIIGVATEEIPIIALGILTSALVGYMAITFLLKYLSSRTLKVFAVYRILLALSVLLIFYL